ncbi:hypothetical protein UFOVP1492_51 [uncultured Caudovirales phage]|uniref:Uncharacterized protein n=1 Tax=uncultured Caudovirales phage TaxID=2100421 RepID=A0A6J5QVV1_9CAUD|nr:hypothetical protein UFOVP1127_83 [uncultured Caudovirales phage]CAB4193678.1 hypothetical protein UFOVP1242_127 [uncultured Caudovirales phage]CAB4217619.1 hypothetical protein UFOVP1492_51 [uncultured Caudovirales phage]CAB5231432.1 hypothetical protein UFOVP1580_80 [uncultured Caudovirales phage]
MSILDEISSLLDSIDWDNFDTSARGVIADVRIAIRSSKKYPESLPLSEGEKEIFNAFRWPENVCLIRSSMLGEPVAIIAASTHEEGGDFVIHPVFVMVTPHIMEELEKPS